MGFTELSGQRGLRLRDGREGGRTEAMAEDGAQLLNDGVILEGKRMTLVMGYIIRLCSAFHLQVKTLTHLPLHLAE